MILGISISVGFSVAAHNKVTKLSSVVTGPNSLALGCSSIKFSKDVFSVVVVVVVVLGVVVVVLVHSALFCKICFIFYVFLHFFSHVPELFKNISTSVDLKIMKI